MISNHYVLNATSGSNKELPTTISVDITDWLIPNMELFCFDGGWNILPLIFFFKCGFGCVLFMALCGGVFFLVDCTPCEDWTM